MSVVFDNLSISNEILGSGMSIRRPVRVATTANGLLATAFQNGSTVDGVVLATGERILLKNQSAGIENGIYVVKASGAPNRSDDMGAGSLAVSVMILVEEGTVNADTTWMIINDTIAATVNSNALVFQQISGNGVDGNMYGPVSSTDTAVVRFSGTDGKNLQDSAVLIDGSGNLSGIGNITLSGTVDGRDIAGDAAHFTDSSNPHSVTKAQVGLSDVPNIKQNLAASVAPSSVTDDVTLGYSVGSRWFDTTADKEYVCLDATDGAAVWIGTTVLDHTLLTNIGTNTHSQIDTHLADATLHFTEGSIDHTAITNIGTNTHAQIDSHLADATLHFTEGSIDHTAITNIGTNTHAQIDTHLASTSNPHSVTKTQVGLSNVDNLQQIPLSEKGAANGVATLGAGGKVPASQLDLDSVDYQGTWNASTNSPALVSSVGTKGHYYVVSVDGSTSLDGITDWKSSDWVIFNGTVWEKSDHTDQVTSVAGMQGAVALDTDDVTEAGNLYYTDARFDTRLGTKNTTNLSEGTNLYYTEDRVDANSNVVANTAKVSADGSVTTHSDIVVTGVTDNEVLAYNTGTSKWINQTAAEAGLASASHTHTTGDITTGTFVDARIAQSNVTQHEGSITHQNLSGAGTNTHAQIDSHVADSTLHFTEGSIDHTAITNIGTNTHAQIDTHLASTSNPHTVTKAQVGLTNVPDLKQNLAASVAPSSVTDDVTLGYSVGSRWFDTTADKEYVCLDATDGAAVWTETTSPGVLDHTLLTNIGTNTHAQLDSHLADATLHFTEGSIDHTAITNIGTNTHAQLDTHLASTSNPHSVTKTQVGLSNVDNLQQIPLSQKGAANGVATLGAGGKVPASQLDLDSVDYQGTWNASTNSPALVSSVGTKGFYYVVSVDGSTSLDGITDWKSSDWVIFNGTVWEKSDHTDQVTSVAGMQGAVTLDTGDVTEAGNLYYTEARVNANTNVSSNTTHSGLTNNPHAVTKAQVGLTNVPDIKQNLAASTAPSAATDDTTLGYSVGSRWFDTTADKEYVCLDATDGAAVWIETTSSGVLDHTLLTNIGTNTHAQIDSHVADSTLHFTEGSIDHTSITNIGSNTHAQIDTHISATSAHGVSGSIVGTTDTQTLTNKTLTSAVLTTPQINDTSTDHQYIFGVSELTLDRTVTLPLLTGNDTFVFANNTETLTNKTINTASNTLTISASDITTGTLGVSRGGIGANTLTQDGWLMGNGTGAITAIKNNMNASVAPAAGTDDTTLGYAVGSRWFDTTANKEYVCLDNTDTAAVWTETTAGGGSGHTIKDEGTGMTARSNLNFVGTGVTITDTPGSDESTVTIPGGDALATVYSERTTDYTMTNVYTDVTFDTTHLETDAATLDHDNTNRERFTALMTGYYKFDIACIAENIANATRDCSFRLYKNNTSLIPGSEKIMVGMTKSSPEAVSYSLSASLTASDYVTFQTQTPTSGDVKIYDVSICVVKMDGIQGPVGPVGADGDITWQNAWITSTAYNANQAVENNGSSYVCISNHTSSASDEPGVGGSWATYWNLLASKGDQGPAGGGGESNTLTSVGAGVSIVSGKVGVDLQANSLVAASSKISIALDDPNNEVDFDVVEGNIVIGNLSGAPTGSVVGTTDTQTLSGKTLTAPQINDTSLDHQYIFGVSELTLDRTVTLPLLTGNDTFVFANHTETLTNKTINTASNTLTIAAADITTGTLGVARGGSGATTLTQDGWLMGNGTGAITSIKNNMGAAVAPAGATDDVTLGYAVGSRWFDTTADKEYVCLDATDGAAVWTETTGAGGSGETNTMSNVGVAGVSIFKQKTGVDFEVKKINAGALGGVTITDDTGNNEIDIDLDINALTADATPVGSTDYVVTYDATAGVNKKVLINDLPVTATTSEATLVQVRNETGGAITKGRAVFTSGFNATEGLMTIEHARADNTAKMPVIGLVNDASIANNSNGYIIVSGIISGIDTSGLTQGADIYMSISIGSLTTTNPAAPGVISQVIGVCTYSHATLGEICVGAITQHDDTFVTTTGTQTLTNKTINTASNTLVVDAADIGSGTLGVARGGTGAATLTQDGWLMGNGTGAVTAIKNNMAASVAPAGATDDTTLGYAVGSRWFDTTADKEYVCLDNTDGAAVWIETTGGGGSGETNTLTSVGAGVSIVSGKVGVDLQANSLVAASSKISISLDDPNNEVDFDVVEANIVIGNLSGAPTGAVVGTTDTQTLSGKTLTSAILTTPQINDTSLDHQYIFGVSELTLDRTVTLPLLTGNDTFVFANHTDTLTNKTINTASNTLTIAAADITTGTLGVARGGSGATTLTQDGWLMGNGTGAITSIKNNMAAAVGPAAGTDDVTLGYAVGSRWFDTTADKEYVCLDNTDGAAVWIETTGAGGSGETNTMSNVGTAGVSIFKQKTGVDFEVKKINAGSAAITITDDTGNNEIDIDLAVNALTADATPDGAADYVITYDSSATGHKKVLLNNLPNAAGGETNTMSNVGVAGVGIFKQKTGVDFEVKKINAGSSAITITDDTGNNEIDIDIGSSVATLTGTQTLTNKTISASTNTVGANELRTTGASVVIDTAAPPTTGQVLKATSATAATWQTPAGGGGTYGSQYTYAESLGITSGTNTTFLQKLRMTTANIPAGDYRISWSYQLLSDKNSVNVASRTQVDDTTTLQEIIINFATSGLYYPQSGFAKVTLTNAVHNIDIDYRTDSGSGAGVKIKDARVELYRIS